MCIMSKDLTDDGVILQGSACSNNPTGLSEALAIDFRFCDFGVDQWLLASNLFLDFLTELACCRVPPVVQLPISGEQPHL